MAELSSDKTATVKPDFEPFGFDFVAGGVVLLTIMVMVAKVVEFGKIKELSHALFARKD